MNDKAKEIATSLRNRLEMLAERVKRVPFVQRSGLVPHVEGLARLFQARVLGPLQARLRRTPKVGDEHAMRRAAEQANGGLSTAESKARYDNGENKGGTHGGKAVHFEGPEHQRPELDEPQAREPRMPHQANHLGERRAG